MDLKKLKIALFVFFGIAAVVLLVSQTLRVKKINKQNYNESAMSFDTDWEQWAKELYAKLQANPKYGVKEHPYVSDMIWIEPGDAFVGGHGDDTPNHPNPYRQVHVPGFYVDKKPATRYQYSLCVKEKMCLPPLASPGKNAGPHHPVIVDFMRAKRYCEWQGKRLLRQVEWEKAARGTDGRIYPWGNSEPNAGHGNFCDKNCTMKWADKNFDDGFAYTSPVGAYPAGNSPYGLEDIAGNVKEWVSGHSPDPKAEHVAMGSSWYSTRDQMALYTRQDFVSGVRLDDKGVRCAASAQ